MQTAIDWCTFRTQAEVEDCLKALRGVYGSMGDLITLRSRRGGWNGFEQAYDVCMGDMPLALMAYGGEAQRGWINVSITGRGCEWCLDWERAHSVLTKLLRFEWRRIDIALTVKDGSINHERVVLAHANGEFQCAGRPPVLKEITHSDPLAGRTAYVGVRTSGKYLRCYEKGLELVKGKAPGLNITHLDGVPILDIYRVELELKAKDFPLPIDIVMRRDDYFAGAYPFNRSLIDAKPMKFFQKRERLPQRDLELALMNIQYQYGKTLFTALMAFGGDVSSVWDKIVGSQHSEALLNDGVLLVDH
jgi:phage replication initiation protein